ncbi:hypothetical protein ACFE04_006087 [Oxalis oulophora]
MGNYWWIIFFLALPLYLVHGKEESESLDSLLYGFVNTTLSNHRTGRLYKVVLPSNFSAVEVSVVRLRSSTLWAKGADFSYYNIPRRSVPIPYVKRIALVYDNLGNLSTRYFRVPTGYNFAAPVIGFHAYNATNVSSLGVKKLRFSDTGYPISINFSSILMGSYCPNLTYSCVKFNANWSVSQWTNMTKTKLCFAEDSGYFSVIIPYPITVKKKNDGIWLWWWVIAGAAGLGVLGFLFVVMLLFRKVKKRRVKKMEKEAEKCVALDRFHIGRSVMPSASMIRTQPIIENDLVP